MSRRAILSIPRAVASLSTPSVRPGLAHTATPLSRPLAAQSQRRSYHEKVLDHYSNPRNVGSMNKNDADVGTGKSRTLRPSFSTEERYLRRLIPS